ncbi:glycine zipper 2TM domain-containing protein [uncultured Erythrobacter sp.]|uniref:glycine zipper 2TM domain-containing protein n=1 Tax=uncultured Erythrobacter sp. TaxID=263913 RepID=UPI0026016A7E|nr:glycine zipper 2TM domain-containing protein [uncultured Erythrobacter sp.]
MKTVALIAATGSLAALSAPAQAAEFAPISDIAGPIAPSPMLDMNMLVQFDDDDDRHYRRGRGHYDDRIYDRRGRYREPRRIRHRNQIWRGRDGRYYCKRDNGTTGLVIGAGVGALLGRTIDTRGDRTVGTLLGGALGAVIGRELDRGDVRCR